MSIHIYVLPLSAYFANDYQSILEKLTDLTGKPGHEITAEGISDSFPARPTELEARRAREAVKGWVGELRRHLSLRFNCTSDWDESGGLRYSANMSWSAYGSVYEYARQIDNTRGLVIQRLMTVNIMLPLAFGDVADYPGPFEPTGLKIASSEQLLRELNWLTGVLTLDERMKQLASLPPRTVVSGDLADLLCANDTMKTMSHVCALSVGQHIPVVLE